MTEKRGRPKKPEEKKRKAIAVTLGPQAYKTFYDQEGNRSKWVESLINNSHLLNGIKKMFESGKIKVYGKKLSEKDKQILEEI